MSILLIAEHTDGALSPAFAHTVTAATQIGGDIHALVAGKDCSEIASAAAEIQGVNKVLVADDGLYEHQLTEPLAALLTQLSGDYKHVIAAASKYGKNLLPRVAALLDVSLVTEITAVVSADTFERPIYAGNAIATVQATDSIIMLSVRATSFEAAPQGANAPIEAVASAGDPGLSEFIGQELSVSERPELASAKIVISGGRGMQNGENFKLLEGIADHLNAAIGASRAAVDAGYVPNDFQVGQTGKVVAPDLYIAVGISGAIQHLAGMKDSKVIVAINKDDEAPIFQVADYGLVADLFDVLPALEAELKNAS